MAREDLHFRLRIPEDLKKRVEKAATENHRSMTAEIIATLQDAYPDTSASIESLQSEGNKLLDEIINASDTLARGGISVQEKTHIQNTIAHLKLRLKEVQADLAAIADGHGRISSSLSPVWDPPSGRAQPTFIRRK